MDPEHLPSIINLGVGGVLFFLYLKQETRMIALQEELNEVRKAQWALIVSLVGEEIAHTLTPQPKL